MFDHEIAIFDTEIAHVDGEISIFDGEIVIFHAKTLQSLAFRGGATSLTPGDYGGEGTSCKTLRRNQGAVDIRGFWMIFG